MPLGELFSAPWGTLSGPVGEAFWGVHRAVALFPSCLLRIRTMAGRVLVTCGLTLQKWLQRSALKSGAEEGLTTLQGDSARPGDSASGERWTGLSPSWSGRTGPLAQLSRGFLKPRSSLKPGLGL